MMLQALHQTLHQRLVLVLQRVEKRFKHWSQPTHTGLLMGTIADMTRNRSELVAENAFLRQQLIVLRRQTKRPELTSSDRGLLVVLASRLRTWKESLLIAKPETLLHWHRQGFRLFWRHKSKAKTRQSRIPPDIVALIHTMALDNRLWGAKRIQDELRKLGYLLNKRTVAKYMRQARRTRPPQPNGQTRATFLKNHAHDIWACDFLQTYDWLFRTIFVFFIIELGSRRVVHFAVTRSPSDTWVAQQLREATPLNTSPLRVSRAEKFTLALLAIHLKRTTAQHIQQLSASIRIFRPETVQKWHRELVRRKWTHRHRAQSASSSGWTPANRGGTGTLGASPCPRK